MKKVLFTATVDSHILAFHLPFLKYFKELGYETHVATNGIEEIPYCDKKHTISFERNPFKLNNLKAISKLKKVLEKEKFDIVFTNTPMGSVVTRLACKKIKKNSPRVIYMAHGLHFYKGASLKNWLLFYPVEKYLSKYTDTLILINQEDYQLAKKKFRKCKDIEYVPGVGIDPEKFSFELSYKEKEEFRKSLGFTMKDFVLIYPAEISKRKRQMWLIESLKPLLIENASIHLLLAGRDSLNRSCHKYVEKIGLEKQIHFLGFRNDIPKLFQISNLAVSSASQEGLPVNIMEAMATGLPVVASNCRGNHDLIVNGVNGYLIDLKDKKKFLDKVHDFYANKEDYSMFSHNNKTAIQNYYLENIMIEMKKIFQKRKVIIHVLASNIFSGAENVVCTIIKNTSDDYTHYYCSPDGPIRDILKQRNVNFIPLKKLSYSELKKVLKAYHPDILHAHDFKASCLSSFFSKNLQIISHLHNNPLWIQKKNIKSVLYKICSKEFQKILVVSAAVYNEYVYRETIISKCEEISNIVDDEEVKEKALEPYSKHFDVAFFGRITEQKQPLTFLKIIKEYEQIYNKKLDVCFLGDGELKEECFNKIEELQLKSTVKFLGFQENPFKIIKNCRCVIMPSLYEGFGLTAVESMVLGCPVLNSGVGGLSQVFSSNPWYICHSTKEYTQKLHEILTKKVFPKLDIQKYIDKKFYAKKIKQIYEE